MKRVSTLVSVLLLATAASAQALAPRQSVPAPQDTHVPALQAPHPSPPRTFTYDHVMLIYGKALDDKGRPFYLVKNSWGDYGPYNGTWYMSRDYIALNTTYIFLNRNSMTEKFRKASGI